MNRLKRIFCLFLVLALSLSLFVACGNKKEDEFNKLSPAQKFYQAESGISVALSNLLSQTTGIKVDENLTADNFNSSSFDLNVNELAIGGQDLGLDLGLSADILADEDNGLYSMDGKLSALGDTLKLSVQSDKDSLFIGSDGLLPKPIYVPLDMLKKLFAGGATSGYSEDLTSSSAYAFEDGYSYTEPDLYDSDYDEAYTFDDGAITPMPESSSSGVAVIPAILPILKEFFTEENSKHLKDLVIAAVPEEIFSEKDEKISLHFTEGQEFETACVSAEIDGHDFVKFVKNLLSSAKTDSVVNSLVAKLVPYFTGDDADFDFASTIDKLIESLDKEMNDDNAEMDNTVTINCYYYEGSLIKIEVLAAEAPETEGEKGEEVFALTIEGTPKENENFFYASVTADSKTVLTVDGKAEETTSYLKAEFNDGSSGFKLNLVGDCTDGKNVIAFSAESAEDGINYEELFSLKASLKSTVTDENNCSFDGNFVLSANPIKLDFDLSFEAKALENASVTLPSKEDACDISDENQFKSIITVLLMNMQTKLPNISSILGGANDMDYGYDDDYDYEDNYDEDADYDFAINEDVQPF